MQRRLQALSADSDRLVKAEQEVEGWRCSGGQLLRWSLNHTPKVTFMPGFTVAGCFLGCVQRSTGQPVHSLVLQVGDWGSWSSMSAFRPAENPYTKSKCAWAALEAVLRAELGSDEL